MRITSLTTCRAQLGRLWVSFRTWCQKQAERPPLRVRFRAWRFQYRAHYLLAEAERFEAESAYYAHHARCFRDAAHTAQLQADILRGGDGRLIQLRRVSPSILKNQAR